MIRVLVADDEAVVRAGVLAILGSDDEIAVVAQAADGRTAVDLAMRHRPDVAVLDIRMPDGDGLDVDGLDAGAEIRRLCPDTAVVLLTTFSEDAYISRALDAGVAGFLLKSGDPRDLIAGVRAAASGAAYLSPRVAARVIAQWSGPAARRSTTASTRVGELTPRERDVLALLGDGLSNAEIGRRLHLVEGTVKGHVSAILTALGVRNRVQAAIVAHEAGLGAARS